MEVEWIHFATIDSTNAWVKMHARELNPKKMTCVVADVQTAGYGSRKRQWVSKKGNLFMTLFFRLSPSDPRLPNIGQILSVACCRLLHSDVQIRWPNDLIYDGKKLFGVLVETIPLESDLGIAVGVGMNVNHSVQTDQPTISLFEMTGEHRDVKALAKDIIMEFSVAFKEGFGPIREEYARRVAYKNCPISFFIGEKEIQGTLMGVDDQGRVQIQKKDGNIATFASGKLHTLRKK